MSDPSSLTNVQLPTDSIPRMASAFARRRGTTDVSIPWTADELLASAAASKIQHSSSLDADTKVVSGGSHRPPNADPAASSRQATNANAGPDPTLASHPADSLELATPTAPFMNPLPQHHHQSNQLVNQMGPASSPLPSEQGPLGPSFMQYPQAQTASPYPPSTPHYFPSQQQQTYPGQSQLPTLNSYRPATQQQLPPQTTTPKSNPAPAYPWNAVVGSSPETVSKPPASSVDNVTVSPATTAQSTSTGATSATMLPSGSSRPSTATYDSHDTSPVIPNYPAVELMQSQTGGQQSQLPQSMQVSVQPQRAAAHPIAMQMSAAAAGVSPPLASQGSYLGHSTPYQHSHRNSISSRPNDVGEWTAEEVARLAAIIRNSNMNVGYPNANGMSGSGGITPETDWAKVVNAFNNTRPR